jgi:cobalt/nickel transport system permease protein
MHIPDGYLSPATCAVLYAAVAPFWYTASHRIQRLLGTRLVPRVALFAAFSFVVMMFNIPLPGGTTGHAVGVGIATVTLGPWAAMLAVSVALAIQALFFGDGGVLAFGANSFNIAVVGALAASWTYRAIARGAPQTSSRRVVAAGIAGYVAVNASALLTAIELGIQPSLFHDATGAPLYAPYPLAIAIPAMMIGHLTIAGFAEGAIGAGIVAFLQTSDPELLALPEAESVRTHMTMRRLWVGLGVLLVATPLGLLAAGTAWGEWAPEDFRDAETRAEIADTSGGVAPVAPPKGLERLAQFWTAPIPDYAPSVVRDPSIGYILSGVVGAGTVILAVLGIGWIVRTVRTDRTVKLAKPMGRGRRSVERTIAGMLHAIERSNAAESVTGNGGLLQRLDPRVKVVGLLALVLAVTLAHRIEAVALVFVLACVLALLSRLSLATIAKRAWLPVLFFTVPIALPALVTTPGTVLVQEPQLGMAITEQGVRTVVLLCSRALAAATVSLLLVMTTSWPHLLKALRAVGVPAIVVAVLGMTHRYLFTFLQSAVEMFEARRSRTVGTLDATERRRLAATAAGVLLARSIRMSDEVYLAMRSRGYRGEIRILDELRLRSRDILALVLFLAAAVAVTVVGWNQ